MATYELSDIITTVNRAVLEGIVPHDLAQSINKSVEVFRVDASSFGAQGLHGQAKYAELVLKLAYWVAIRHLTPDGFRTLQAKIPHDNNRGWGVEEPGYSGDYFGAPPPPDKALGPVLCSPGNHTEGSDTYYSGQMYLSNGKVLGGGSIRVASVAAPAEEWDGRGSCSRRPHKQGCLLTCALVPFIVAGRLVERLFTH